MVVLLTYRDSAKPFTVIYHQFDVYLYLNTQQNYSIPINVLVMALISMSIIVNYLKKPSYDWYLMIGKLISSVLILPHFALLDVRDLKEIERHLKEIFVQRFPI